MAKIKIANPDNSPKGDCCPPKSKMNPAKTRKRTQPKKKPTYTK